MITKIKKCSKLLALATLIGFASCQKDFHEPTLKPNKTKSFTVTEKYFKDLIADEKFSDAFTKIKKSTKGFSNISSSRCVMENQHNFTIVDSIPAKIVQNDQTTSYTFSIIKDSAACNIIQNLVVQTTPNQETIAAIVKYETGSPITYSADNSYKLDIINTKVERIDYHLNRTTTCTAVTVTICTNNGGQAGEPHIAGPECRRPEFQSSVNAIECVTSEDSGGGGGLDPNNGSTTSYSYDGVNISQGGSGTSTGGITTTQNQTNVNSATTTPLLTAPVVNEDLNVTTPNNSFQNFISGLLPNQSSFLNSKPNLKIKIFAFLNQNSFSNNSQTYIQNAINYMMSNPNVSFTQYQNWFSNTKAGNDDSFDESFWNSSTSNFPPQNKPSYDDFYIGYPLHSDLRYNTPLKMFTAVGGMPLAIFNSSGNPNTCALRVSFALHESGINIPNIPGKTFKGANNKYYFLGAANLLAWMKKTFGTPTGTNHLIGAQGGVNGVNFPTLLAGKKGIYCMIPNSISAFGASGHVDILYPNTTCDGDCFFNADGGVKEIFIFELP